MYGMWGTLENLLLAFGQSLLHKKALVALTHSPSLKGDARHCMEYS